MEEKIKIYEYPPIFSSVEYFKFVDELGKKLVDDQKILQKNQSLSNKIAYTRNLLMQHHLFVEGTIINSEIAKSNLKYQKDGWFIWLQTFNFTSGHHFATQDEEFTYLFDALFDKFFVEIVGNKYYNESLFNYKNGNYYACVCCLFPLIENMEKQISKFNGEKIFNIKRSLANTHVPEEHRCREYFEEFEMNMNNFLKENIYSSSTETEKEPKVISRNRVMHGIFTRNIDKTDCLKLLCIYKSMYGFNDWLKSLEVIKKLTNDLKKLETETDISSKG